MKLGCLCEYSATYFFSHKQSPEPTYGKMAATTHVDALKQRLDEQAREIEHLRALLLDTKTEAGPDEPKFREGMREFHSTMTERFEAALSKRTFSVKSFPVYLDTGTGRPAVTHGVQKVLWDCDQTCAVNQTKATVTVEVTGDLGRAARYLLHALTPFRVQHYTGPMEATLESRGPK